MDIEILGFIAGIIVLVAHFPQIIKSVKSKQTKDISLMLYCMIWTAMLLWLIYGYYKDALAVFVMNSISITSVSTMIYLKLKYGMNKYETKGKIDRRRLREEIDDSGPIGGFGFDGRKL